MYRSNTGGIPSVACLLRNSSWVGSARSSELCRVSCAARRLSILLLPRREFWKRAVEDTAAEAKERGRVPGGREMQEEQSRELCRGLWKKKEERVEVRDTNTSSQPP